MTAVAVGLTAVAQIGSAVAGTIVLVKKMTNEHDVQLAVISNQHEQAMFKLNSEGTEETNKHEEFMELLKVLKTTIDLLGKEIFDAECDGCKGLPGKKDKNVKSV